MQPLAERLRPKTLDDYIGQKHLVGPGAILRKMIDAGRISSFILWGPPGVGKTTLAQIIANKLETPFYTLSAVTSGVKDVREVIDRAKSNKFFTQSSPILFIDEIHRFSKSQQDSLLGAVEHGTVTLIGATTEFRSYPSAPFPLSALHTEISGKRRFTGIAATCHYYRRSAERTENRIERDRCHASLFGRRCPQITEHTGTRGRIGNRRNRNHH